MIEHIDSVTIVSFISSFFIMLFFGYLILVTFKLDKIFYGKCMIFSLIGHYIGGLFFFWYSLSNVTDVWGYFVGNQEWGGFGPYVVGYISWHLRDLFFGDSYLATYSFFIDIGFLGSMFYFISYHQLYLRIINRYEVSVDFKKLKWGYVLIACWPSSLFWTTFIGKDSLVCFGIALFFVSLVQMRQNKLYLLTLFGGAALAFLVRPYLLFVGVAGFFLWLLFAKKRTHDLLFNLFLLIVVALFLIVAFKTSMSNGFLYLLNDSSFSGIVNKGIAQQQQLVGGSSVPIPTKNPSLLPLFLPYLILVNLFLPLFFAIRNFFGVIASCQNVLLLILCYKFIKQWSIWCYIKKIPIISYMFWFFIAGMSLLGLINTNLGLADREKLMYLPPFLIVMFLTLAIKSFKRE